jgi:AmmeMemoRadiSam system protein A
VSFTLSIEEKIILLRTARIAILERLGQPAETFPEPTPPLTANCGAFVSLHIDGNLRGCIGYITAHKPLVETVKEMACSAAFSDPRFSPLESGEVNDTEIEISVLSPFTAVKNIADIEVGVHGIMVRRGMRSGLLLPQVATEYGWDREEFISHTCRKAGLPPNDWRKSGLEIEIFSAAVFSEKDVGLR